MLNQRQELFIQNILTGKSAGEAAKLAGYSEKTAYSMGPRLLRNVVICERISALQLATTDGTIATVSKRKEILTEIATEGHKQPITAQDKVRAIAELNKMERVYETDSIHVDNRTINIYTNSEKAKELTQKLIEGERTE